MKDEFLRIYNDELSYLRIQGDNFAKTYPKIASRLRLGQGGVEDPMVGRLLESFAFLSARLGVKLNQNTDFMTSVLIGILYPHYGLPIPSFSTCQFQPKLQLDASYTIPSGTRISADTSDGETCYFTTCYPATVWPIHLSTVSYKRQCAIRPKNHALKTIKSCFSFTLKVNNSDVNMVSVRPDHLRFFIRLESHQSNLLCELLMNNLKEIVLNFKGANGKTISLPENMIKSVGFSDDESILEFPGHSFSGYRLLSEYFAYPEKFFYFDLIGLNQYLFDEMNDEVEIHCLLDQSVVELEKAITVEALALGCTPIVNLFEQIGEPIKIDHHQSEYHVVADAHSKQDANEIYQVTSVDISSDSHVEKMTCVPYFGNKFRTLKHENQLYWFTTRKQCWELGSYHTPGAEVFISFSAFGSLEQLNDHVIVTPKLLCTNRDKPSQLPMGKGRSDFHFWRINHEVIESIKQVKPMTAPVFKRNTDNDSVDLMSHVFLNHLCFDQDEDALNVLKDNLALYCLENEYNASIIGSGLLSVQTKQVTERHPINLKQGFCRGIEYTLTIDEKYFTDNNAYLFGKVLSEYLTKSCSINSFVKFILKSKQRGEVARWKPKLGARPTC